MAEAMRRESIAEDASRHDLARRCGHPQDDPHRQPARQPEGVRENLAVILPALKHAIEKIKGDPADCGS